MSKIGERGDGKRVGAVKGRTQALNPKTKRYVKRDTETGRIIDMKADRSPFSQFCQYLSGRVPENRGLRHALAAQART